MNKPIHSINSTQDRRYLGITYFAMLLGVLIAVLATSRSELSAFGRDSESTIQFGQSTVAETPDFATVHLRDPWDMTEYSDISQFMNISGQLDLTRNIAVKNGVFSASSAGAGEVGQGAFFFLLFPGYPDVMQVGKIGVHAPIDSAEYNCLYLAMKVDSTTPAPGKNPDQWRAEWYADQRLNLNGAPYGLGQELLYPEAGKGTPTPDWRLHKMNLGAPSISPTTLAAWRSQNSWQGLRIDPSMQAGATFAVDWARLTTCDANEVAISWTPNRTITAIWLKEVDSDHFVRVAADIAGERGAYDLDIQGVIAGEYTVGLGDATSCCIEESSEKLTIQAAPIVHFVKPSFTSGVDYATLQGNTWDFSDASDVVDVGNIAIDYQDGNVDFTTPPGRGLVDRNPQLYLNVPTTIDTKRYRYMTFRMYTEWDASWQDIVSGMVARWIWRMPSINKDSIPCDLVSQDIPFDIGWQTYTIDLHHFFNGGAEATSPANTPRCPPISYPPQQPPVNVAGNQTHWFNTQEVIGIRFDPNENISCGYAESTGKSFIPCSDYRQKIDWITLTAVDEVQQGEPYEITLDLNQVLDSSELTYYYTTDSAQPRQNRAVRYEETIEPAPRPNGKVLLYLPVAARPASKVNGYADVVQPQIPATFAWDTADVAPGAYTICVDAGPADSALLYCSEAQINVLP